MSESSERPTEVVDFTPDTELFPFESHWFDSSVGPVHYVDEGAGRPVLLLHGNPDWSFLYRRIIGGLRGRFRCIAPDYPGFGLSAHPTGYGFTPAEHAVVIGELVDELDLDDLVVVGQDWGGPIGLRLAADRADRVSGLVMGNTWFWPADDRAMRTFSRVMGSRPFRWLIRERNFFIEYVMRRSLVAELSDREFDHYRHVVPGPEWREGIAVFPREINGSADWLRDLERDVTAELGSKRTVLVFGRKDTVLGSDRFVARWRAAFPEATYVDLPDANHYIQEDAPEAIVDAIIDGFG